MIKQTAYLIYNLISLDHSIERVGLRLQWFIYGTVSFKKFRILQIEKNFSKEYFKIR